MLKFFLYLALTALSFAAPAPSSQENTRAHAINSGNIKTTTPHLRSSNLSVGTRGAPFLYFEIGNKKQNVGNISSDELYRLISAALVAIMDNVSTPLSTTFKIKKPCKSKWGDPAVCNTDMTIRKVRHVRTTSEVDGLMQHAIAQAVARMVDVREKNCWHHHWRRADFGWFCNIADHISIEVPDGARVDIRFESENKNWGQFDCVGCLTPINNLLKEQTPRFETMTHIGQITYFSFCPDIEVTRREGGES